MAAGPLDAARDLRTIGEARQATVRQNARPVWLSALQALTIGAGASLTMVRRPRSIALALLLLAASLWIVWRRDGRRGRIQDARSTLRSMVLAVPVACVVGWLMEQAPGWRTVAAGAGLAAWAFLCLRVEERQQRNQLAAGDFDPADLA